MIIMSESIIHLPIQQNVFTINIVSLYSTIVFFDVLKFNLKKYGVDFLAYARQPVCSYSCSHSFSMF